jgi:hypothetical protein
MGSDPNSTWFGVGARSAHARDIDATPRAVDWYELVADELIGIGGAERARLERLRAEVPVALHGVSLGVAGSDPLDGPFLRGLRDVARWIEPAFVSDHLCWTSLGGHQSHDLLPVAYTEAVLDHVCERVDAAQSFLGRRLFLENASAYVAFRADAIDEAAFLAALCHRTGCGLLLDVNNLFVNAANLGIDPSAYLAAIPSDAAGYMHLAGHAVLADVRIDTHAADVPEGVWELYAHAARRFPSAPVIVERDDAIPPFGALVAEAHEAKRRHAEALASQPDPAPRDTAPITLEARAVEGWHSVQKDFFERLVDKPLGHAHADAATLLDDTRPVRAARGLRVYSDAYTASLRSARATNFPALARALRADDFGALAAAYLRAHPPRAFGFVGLGAALAAFTRDFAFAADYGAARDAFADLVALEQAQLEVQRAPDADARLAPSGLAAIDAHQWPDARFAFVPAARIVECEYDVLPAIEAVSRGEDPPKPERRAVAYLLHRGAIGVRTEAIASDAARVLAALAAGQPFAAACDASPDGGADEAARVERGLRALLLACERGVVAGCAAAG